MIFAVVSATYGLARETAGFSVDRCRDVIGVRMMYMPQHYQSFSLILFV